MLTKSGWVNSSGWSGIDISEFPELSKWVDRINERAAVNKGLNVPEKFTLKERMKDKASADAHAAETSKWIQEAMKNDSKK
jgi:glutathione S-transferase